MEEDKVYRPWKRDLRGQILGKIGSAISLGEGGSKTQLDLDATECPAMVGGWT